MHALHALLGKEKLARPKYWYCHCCLKQNTTVHDDPALNKCVTCGRPGTYTQDGCALPLHGKGGAVYRPEQVVNVLDNLDESDMYNWTALHSAAAKGNAAVVRELLELGATADALTKHKQTPLHLAVYAGSLPSVKLLVEAGARVNCVTQLEKNTPLHMAVEGNWRDISFYLIHNGADVNAENVLQRTPLHMAATHGRLEIGMMLLKGGSNPDKTDINGWNPRQVAELNGHVEFQELLIHRNVKDKQPQLERLPEAPWHGDLWTRVMDAQHKKRAEYERSVEMARKREEEIRQGLKKVRSGARTRSVMKVSEEGHVYYVEEEYEDEEEVKPVRTLLGPGKMAEHLMQKYPLARYPWARDPSTQGLLATRMQAEAAARAAAAEGGGGAAGATKPRRRRPKPMMLEDGASVGSASESETSSVASSVQLPAITGQRSRI